MGLGRLNPGLPQPMRQCRAARAIQANMQPDKSSNQSAQQEATPNQGQAFQWLPDSRLARMLLAALGLAFVGVVFSAYLHPNMVFDLANMVFCG